MEDRIDFVSSLTPKGIDRSRFMQDREISSLPVVNEVWLKEELDQVKHGSGQVVLTARLISYVQGPRAGSPGHLPEQWDRNEHAPHHYAGAWDAAVSAGGGKPRPSPSIAAPPLPSTQLAAARPTLSAGTPAAPTRRAHTDLEDLLRAHGPPRPASAAPAREGAEPAAGAAAHKADVHDPRSAAPCLLPGMPDRPPPAARRDGASTPVTRAMPRTALDPGKERAAAAATSVAGRAGTVAGDGEATIAALIKCVLDDGPAALRLKVRIALGAARVLPSR